VLGQVIIFAVHLGGYMVSGLNRANYNFLTPH
jgi:hypothetical protein